MTSIRSAVLGLTACLLLAGCSGGDASGGPPAPALPDASSFAAGTCQAAAPDVLAVGRAIPRFGSDKTVPGDVKTSLRDAQDRLSALAEAAEPSVRPALQDLVVSIGLLRIRADGNTYEPSLGRQVSSDYDSVVRACTGT